MLAIRASTESSSPTQSPMSTAHLLPCRIHSDGPVHASRRYWDPKPGHDGKPEAYFRGRRLKGRPVRVPEGYRGVVVREVEGGVEKLGKDGAIEEENLEEHDRVEEEEEEEGEDEVKALGEVARFEELVLWGHETIPEDDHVFVKGVEEWIRFAAAIHAHGNSEPESPSPGKN